MLVSISSFSDLFTNSYYMEPFCGARKGVMRDLSLNRTELDRTSPIFFLNKLDQHYRQSSRMRSGNDVAATNPRHCYPTHLHVRCWAIALAGPICKYVPSSLFAFNHGGLCRLILFAHVV